jgi:hypothetical protein
MVHLLHLLSLVSLSRATILYLSVHDAPYNLLALNTDTNSVVTESVLNIASLKQSTSKIAWRGMVVRNDTMVVANSKSSNSFLAMFDCKLADFNGDDDAVVSGTVLAFKDYFTSANSNSNSGLDHPYDIDFYDSAKFGELTFVTVQDTHSVLVYDEYGNPMVSIDNGEYPGAYLTFTPPKSSDNSVRGLAIDNEFQLLFVTVEWTNAFLVYDLSGLDSGARPSNAFNLTYKNDSSTFVGIELDLVNKIAYVGDTDSNRVVAFSYTRTSATREWVAESDELSHPAGIALDAKEEKLYVASQNAGKVLSFDPKNGAFLAVEVDLNPYDVTIENLYATPPGTYCSNF